MTKALLWVAGLAALLGGCALVFLWTPDRPRAELEDAYLRSSADLMEVAGTTLHVRVDGPADGAGDAPAVILLHGFGSSLHSWDAWARNLQEAFRVVRFDLPGAGLSPPDATGRYDDARAFEILLGLMARLGVGEAALIGNSVGGRIAWSFAAEHPGRVTRLVLVAPDGFASAGFDYGQAPEVGALTHAMRAFMPKFLVRMNLVQSYGDPDALDPRTVDRYFDLLRAPGVRKALIDRMEQTVLQDPRPRLAAIPVPVLLLWGEEDRLIPVSNAEDYLAVLPNAERVILPGLGHLPQEEAPAKSLAPAEDFLRPLMNEP